jgi:hypothetical protein
MAQDFDKLTVRDLLAAYVQVLDELKARGVLRTANNPVGDYAEWLVANTLGLMLVNNSTAAYDAIDSEGIKYQIKGRRQTPENMSTQLGMFHNLDRGGFDYLIAVLFQADFAVRRVVKVPHTVVAQYGRYREHTNAHILHMQGTWLSDPRVQDVTGQFSSAP